MAQMLPVMREGAKNQIFKKRFKDVNVENNIAFCADGYLDGSRLCASCDVNHARGSSLGECKICGRKQTFLYLFLAF